MGGLAKDIANGIGTGACAGALVAATGGMALEAAPGPGTLAHIAVVAGGAIVGGISGGVAAAISSHEINKEPPAPRKMATP